jgi:hypothetical protein
MSHILTWLHISVVYYLNFKYLAFSACVRDPYISPKMSLHLSRSELALAMKHSTVSFSNLALLSRHDSDLEVTAQLLVLARFFSVIGLHDWYAEKRLVLFFARVFAKSFACRALFERKLDRAVVIDNSVVVQICRRVGALSDDFCGCSLVEVDFHFFHIFEQHPMDE